MTLVGQTKAVKQQQTLLRGQGHGEGVKKPNTPVGAVLAKRDGQSQTKWKQSFRPRETSEKPGAAASKQPPKTTCSICSKSPSHDRQQCPACDAVCHKCAKRGHYRRHCTLTVRPSLVRHGLHNIDIDLREIFECAHLKFTVSGQSTIDRWTYTRVHNAVMLVWGSLRLAPITANILYQLSG